MRRIVLLSAMLFLSACASRPVPTVTAPAPVQQTPIVRSGLLLGLTAGELIQRLGQPALQVREGAGLKLQFRGRICVLDAYLYPSTAGGERVTHIDTRLTSGADTDQAGCIASLDRA